MEHIKIKEFPRKLENLDKDSIGQIVQVLEKKLKKILKDVTPENKNFDKSINRCLLLLNFLKEDFSEFENLLEVLKSKEIKVGEKEHLYYDLNLLQSNINSENRTTIIEKIEYDKLLRAHLKWQLLFKNLIIIRYEAQMNQIKKSDWLVQPERIVILLETLIDWIYRLPNKSQFLKLIKKEIDQKRETTKRNLEVNEIDLSDKLISFRKTKLAVWDTGIDNSCVKYISPNLSLYYDSKCQITESPLLPLKDISKKDIELYKGFLDLKSSKQSLASDYLLEELSKFDKNGMIKFKDILNQLSIYSHGTTVANVASKDNPNIEIVPIRVTFDSNQSFPTMYTSKRIEQEIKMQKFVFDWIQKNEIQVVNMSWGHRKIDLKNSLQNTGHKNSKSLEKIVHKLFESLRESLFNGIQKCSNTIFITGAGNSNSVLEEEDFIPSSFSLPNLIVVGAVNYKRERTSFTTIGKNINVYANGSNISTIMPGGYSVEASGTSLSAPQVSNLASVILTINPNLTAKSVKKYILENTDLETKEGIHIINPKKTIDSVLLNSNVN